MRLIDADAISYTMLYKEDWLRGTGVEKPAVWKDTIDAMPTIEVKQVKMPSNLSMTQTEAEKTAEYPGCDFCKFDLEDGDYLYQHMSSDRAIIYEEVDVHYCPVCGRKLKGD